MNDFQRYLLDEFAEDYRSGQLSRRDFVVKSIGVAGGLAGAMALFSSLGLSASDVAEAQALPRVMQPGANPITVLPDDPDISVNDVEFESADGTGVLGYLALPSMPGPYTGVVVIHENRGLTDHHKDVVRRFAKAGFAALGPDLISREGGTANVNPDDAPGAISRADPQRHIDDATGAGIFVRSQKGVRPDAHGITGFCFGGGVVWRTIGQDLSVAAAVPFYGPPPPLESLANTHAAALGMYGELDAGITGSAEAVQAALDAAGVPHDYKVYPGANHAFFNDTGARYDRAAATDAWARMLSWFREHVPPA